MGCTTIRAGGQELDEEELAAAANEASPSSCPSAVKHGETPVESATVEGSTAAVTREELVAPGKEEEAFAAGIGRRSGVLESTSATPPGPSFFSGAAADAGTPLESPRAELLNVAGALRASSAIEVEPVHGTPPDSTTQAGERGRGRKNTPPPEPTNEADRMIGVGSVPGDLEDAIPSPFIEGCGNDMVEARERWEATKLWRRENKVDNILSEPQPYFELVKSLYPHCLLAIGKTGHWIYVERPGHANLGQVWKQGLKMPALERHYTFITEFLWRMVDTRPDAKLVSIFDADGCALSHLRGDTLKMFQKCSALLGAHYPERSQKIFIVNAPSWMKMAWSVIVPWIDPRTAGKITVVKKGQSIPDKLAEYVDASDLPPCLGGTSAVPFGQSEVELRMLEHVRKHLADSASAAAFSALTDAAQAQSHSNDRPPAVEQL